MESDSSKQASPASGAPDARFDLQSCDRAIALEPDDADAHNNRANALEALGRVEEAIAVYDQAIATPPRWCPRSIW